MGSARARARRRLDVVELRPSRRDATAVRRASIVSCIRRRSWISRPVTTRISPTCARVRKTCSHRSRVGDGSSVARSVTWSSNGRPTTLPRSTRCSRGSRRNTARPVSGTASISRGSSTSYARWRRPRATASPVSSAPCVPGSTSSPCTSACSDPIGWSGGSLRTTPTSGATRPGSSCSSTWWPKPRRGAHPRRPGPGRAPLQAPSGERCLRRRRRHRAGGAVTPSSVGHPADRDDVRRPDATSISSGTAFLRPNSSARSAPM